ncbi:193_t:CDS:2 [Ambispora gerdemannii]|uniref:193_t:CDS:1 n=1 Tax=Ambispora gerdemannii TaxID=144530 RepID=A0A9N8Z6T1_9GLOM|nr:193_t:CDS:2 [Ambispora gerdemannii]
MAETHLPEQITPKEETKESLCEPTKFKRFTEQYTSFTPELKYLNELDDIFLTLRTDTAQTMEKAKSQYTEAFFSKLKPSNQGIVKENNATLINNGKEKKTATKVKIPFSEDRLAELTKNSKYCTLRLKALNRKAHLDKAADKEAVLEAREKNFLKD